MTLLQMSVMGAVLIGLMAVLRKLAGDRLSPGCYLWLWLAIGLRMLIPVEVSSSFSVYGLFENVHSVPTDTETIPMAQHIMYPLGHTVQVSSTSAWMVNWATLLWLAGAISVLVFIFVQHRRNRRLYNTSLPTEDAFVLEWQRSHTLYRQYQIRQSQQIDTPITYGVICPVILLPANGDMDNTALELVLLHEWNHIRHWDVLWQWMLVLLCSVYWFHPAVWLMSILCRQDLELFCDSATVCRLDPNQRRTYALLLLAQVESRSQMPLFSQFCFTGYHRMEERVKTIMKQKSSNWKTILATVGLLCAGGLCFATSAAGEVNSADQWIAINVDNAVKQEHVTSLVWPVASEDARITLNYGVRTHPVTGETMEIDHICIGGVEKGTDVIAAASGIVKEAGYDTKRGNYLIVQCADDLETHYWHCEKLLVKEGEYVSAYDVIATMGQTGDATGPCLSFAAYQNGKVSALMSWPQYNE